MSRTSTAAAYHDAGDAAQQKTPDYRKTSRYRHYITEDALNTTLCEILPGLAPPGR